MNNPGVMSIPALYKEEENKRTSFLISLGVHLLLLLIMILPFLKVSKPFPPEDGGILVVFGDPDAGMTEAPVEATESESGSPSESTAVSAPTPSKEASKADSKVKNDISDVVAGNSSKKSTDADKAKAEADAKAKQAEKEKAEREAKQKAEYEQSKKQYSDLFGGGKGSAGTEGNQGDPKGDPDGKVLEGITKGTGKIGGGLSGRGVLFEPPFRDNSQKTGRVVLNICVDSSGKVISATFTQKGSTTSDSYLIELARNNALKYKFSKGEVDSQCGTLTIDFKVQ
jgi:hypothetical protein